MVVWREQIGSSSFGREVLKCPICKENMYIKSQKPGLRKVPGIDEREVYIDYVWLCSNNACRHSQTTREIKIEVWKDDE